MIDLLLGLGALVGLVAYGSIAVAVHTVEHDQPVTRDRLATTILGMFGAYGTLVAVLATTQHSAAGKLPPATLLLPAVMLGIAVGIRGTGRAMSRRIATHFGTMSAIRSATADQMAEVEGLGPAKAPSIVEELAELTPVLDRLAELDVEAATAAGSGARNAAATPPSSVEGVVRASPVGTTPSTLPLAGKSICVTGAMTRALAGMSRNEVNELIESLGGRAASSVSAKTDLLLTDDPESGTGKAKKARELGIEIISPDEFYNRYTGSDK